MRRTKNTLDATIERIYYQHCTGVQIDIFDISKVFAAGRAAAPGGEAAMTAAILETVARVRKN